MSRSDPASFSDLAAALLDRSGRRGVTRRATQRRMVAAAREADRAFAHPGPNREDAQRLFWQAAPAILAACPMDQAPRAATLASICALRDTPLWGDIARAPLGEAYLLHILLPMLRELHA